MQAYHLFYCQHKTLTPTERENRGRILPYPFIDRTQPPPQPLWILPERPKTTATTSSRLPLWPGCVKRTFVFGGPAAATVRRTIKQPRINLTTNGRYCEWRYLTRGLLCRASLTYGYDVLRSLSIRYALPAASLIKGWRVSDATLDRWL